ncbi:MAG TPA: sigma-54 dependent transcriptional regulator [Gammaproteobacteria bacterium]|nr:sigma-54 dependent transcriptional regulator [Gammaproteobacteria bacterium]
MTATILVVDDDVSVRTSLELLLKQKGFRSVAAADPAEALDALRRERIDLVIQDMNFSRSTTGEEGLALLRDIRRAHAAVPVVLITAWGSIALAVEGMKLGAADFVTKPWDNERLVQVVRTALSLFGHAQTEVDDREALDRDYELSDILGRDPALVRVLNHVARVARTDAAVLITGESGTGKELLANAIHANSRRAGRPLVKVNMGAIVPALFESEMFGHVRGAFTDAKRDRVGYFEQADGGTIFLDEIAEVERLAQIKLLRVLQDQAFQRVGDGEPRRSNFRVIAATNRNLPELVARGEFREDLYYRLNLITLEMPPLRARKGDIPLIAAHCLREVKERYALGEAEIGADAFRWLMAQTWPGNVRELRHCVERAALMSAKPLLARADFEAVAGAPEAAGKDRLDRDDVLPLDAVEKLMIGRAMRQCEGNVTRASELLGLSRAALYRRLAKHGLPTQ